MQNVMMVVTHKQCTLVSDQLYHPLIVGKGKFEMEHSWRDNTGDNIAEKNYCYCELTALYWFWKNKLAEYDAAGLCHYRRYFTKKAFSNSREDFLTSEDIQKELSQYDIIMPRPFIWGKTVAEIYYEVGVGKEKDLKLTQQAIHELYPEYEKTFSGVLGRKYASYCNMFVMNKALLDEYCTWLFAILEYVENRIDMTDYTDAEKRVYGYLSEILLNVWVEKKQLKVKYLPIAYTELTQAEQKKKMIKECYPLKKILNWVKD